LLRRHTKRLCAGIISTRPKRRCHFQATKAEVVVRKFMLAAGKLSEKEFAAWLKENSRRA
jgi:hypothetical protein